MRSWACATETARETARPTCGRRVVAELPRPARAGPCPADRLRPAHPDRQLDLDRQRRIGGNSTRPGRCDRGRPSRAPELGARYRPLGRARSLLAPHLTALGARDASGRPGGDCPVRGSRDVHPRRVGLQPFPRTPAPRGSRLRAPADRRRSDCASAGRGRQAPEACGADGPSTHLCMTSCALTAPDDVHPTAGPTDPDR